MPELSEMIRDYVDAVAPRISLDDVRERMERRSDASAVRPERRHASVALVVAAAALALALVATLLIVPTGSPPPSAAAVLNEVAMVAAARPKGPVPHSHEYLYYEMTQGSVATTPVSDGHASVLYRYTDVENTWVAPDGTGRQRIAFAARHARLAIATCAVEYRPAPRWAPRRRATPRSRRVFRRGSPLSEAHWSTPPVRPTS